MNALQQMNPPDHIHGDDNLPMNVALCMTEVPVRHCYPVLACTARGIMSVVCLSICKSMRSHYLAPLTTSQHMGSLENSPSLLMCTWYKATIVTRFDSLRSFRLFSFSLMPKKLDSGYMDQLPKQVKAALCTACLCIRQSDKSNKGIHSSSFPQVWTAEPKCHSTSGKTRPEWTLLLELPTYNSIQQFWQAAENEKELSVMSPQECQAVTSLSGVKAADTTCE